MKNYLEILRRCPLFQHIEAENLTTMLGCLKARIETFDRKYTIFVEGTSASHIGIVLSGSVQIVRVDYLGNRNILSIVRAPEVFGEAFACAGVSSTPVSVIANEDCEIMFIDCGHIMHTCANHCAFHQQLIFNLMKDLANKTVMVHQKIEITSKRTTREKLMTYLMIQAKQAKSSSIDIPFNRQELADYLEVERSGLSAEISKLRKEGIIESEKNHFTLLRP